MNVLMHTLSAVGLTLLISTPNKGKPTLQSKKKLWIIFSGFLLGIFTHGILDYIPHCYPINSKVDVIGSMILILTLVYFIDASYKLILIACITGCLLPDIIDLSPQIINHLMDTNLPIYNKIFPWHFPKYSGSIYNNDCENSSLNHGMILVTVLLICSIKSNLLISMFKKE